MNHPLDREKSHLLNKDTGWAVGTSGRLLKYGRTDEAFKWSSQSSGSSHDFQSIFFSDMNSGWIAGGGGTILNTTNGGTNWVIQDSQISGQLNSVFFIYSQTGWIVGEGGVILYTNNGGLNWSPQESGLTDNLESVFFIDDQTGWAVGSSGKIIHTIDSGDNWYIQNSGVSVWLGSIFFTSADMGWAVGDKGTILKTIDGGINWIQQDKVASNPHGSAILYSVNFVDANIGWIGGSGGTILKTTTGGETYVEATKKYDVSIPSLATLWQNYPNPFNSSTLISFDLPEPDFVTLKIFNLNGVEVNTLINKQMITGAHHIKWTPKDLASGIYIYQLQVGKFKISKKLMWQK